MAAVDDDDERTRFSWLAMARYMVASVVTVFAIVVIVLVISVGVFRTEDAIVSVVQGHVGTSPLWKRGNDFAQEVGFGVGSKQHASTKSPQPCRRRGASPYQGYADDFDGPPCSSINGFAGNPYRSRYRPRTTVTYLPVEYLSVGVILSVANPSGRVDIRCDNISVRFLDMPSGAEDFTAGMPGGLGWFYLEGFVVRRQSSHKVTRYIYVNDTNVLFYIARTYGGRSSFTGRVRVTMNISSNTMLTSTSPREICKINYTTS
ncbi:hypothetical protein PVAP13_2NG198100 [Panicum virgatum]|uniref:Uncharacterized protein n=1 Tax=Panicum virgatum TaxID=38727 RepID=A0A8T0VM27_PANVG|nr:hypothetical protein PVAP13_2NG198100 [Panicum virgatum]